MLTFKNAPDYEEPGDVVGTEPSTAAAVDNMYEVTVQATDSTNKVGMKDVVVEVTNVEEMGTVALSALQPQSATPFTASLTDPDGPTPITTGVTWQWAKASSKTGAYTDIEEKANSEDYMPVDDDINFYLRATASYTDGEGSDKSAMVVSEYAVQGVRGTNMAPAFPADDPDTADTNENQAATREVAENTKVGMAIGDPVVAEDKDGDVLTYTLGGTNADDFAIDWATGQLKTKKALDFEDESSYTVTVRATDPAGVPDAPETQIAIAAGITAYSADIVVTIDVTDVNEAPDVTGAAAATYMEVLGTYVVGDEQNIELDYTADDPETQDTNDDSVSTWSLSGVDEGKFSISAVGLLTFKAKPDFEKPGDVNSDNVYEVTVEAVDSNGNRGTMDVKVTVNNEKEPGVVTLSRIQPRDGVSVTASLTDPDGSISGLRWQWYRVLRTRQNAIPTLPTTVSSRAPSQTPTLRRRETWVKC